MAVEFNSSLETGVPLIDKQHKEYISRLNALLKISDDPGGFEKKRLKEGLSFLFNYAVEHFEAEEALMKYSGYPHMPEHLEMHGHFRDGIDEILDKTEETGGFEPEIVLSLKELAHEWFLNHIKTFDASLGKFLKDKEARQSG